MGMVYDDYPRRRFLRGAATAGVISLVGCLGNPNEDGGGGSNGGNGGGGEYSLRVGTSAGGTYDVGAAVERAVSQHSDTLDYATIESPGYIGTIRRMTQGQFNAGITDNNSLTKALDERGSFSESPVDQIPQYGFFAFPYAVYLVALDGSGIETFDDLAGANVYPAEPGYSTRATTLDVWSQEPTADIHDQMNIQNVSVDDAPGAMEEGQIDATIVYGTPGVRYTGYVQEASSRVNFHYVQPTDALIESAESYSGSGTGRTAYENWGLGQDIGTDEVFHWNLEVNYCFNADANNDAVYELCRVVNEHTDTINEAEDQFNDFESSDEMLASARERIPVHPGAAQYYKDNDVWDDSLETGSND